jgi:hypothetical protein
MKKRESRDEESDASSNIAVASVSDFAASPSPAEPLGSLVRFSPVTAPDLRILAMSAALPVRGAGADGAEDATGFAGGGFAGRGFATSAGSGFRVALGAMDDNASTDATDVPSAEVVGDDRRRMTYPIASGAANGRSTSTAARSRKATRTTGTISKGVRRTKSFKYLLAVVIVASVIVNGASEYVER